MILDRLALLLDNLFGALLWLLLIPVAILIAPIYLMFWVAERADEVRRREK